MVVFIEIKSKTRTAGIPALDSKIILNLQLPLPPISTQLRIVEILDKFTSLEKELEKRKLQYRYYRDKLLDLKDNMKYLEEVSYKISDGSIILQKG